MLSALRARRDAFLGRGSAAVTIPAMDGALRPNQRLDDAEVLRQLPAPDNLAEAAGEVFFSSGPDLYRIGAEEPVERFAAPVTALAGHADGRLAAGLDDGQVLLRQGDGWAARPGGGTCPTALAFDGGDLLVAHGSARHPPSRWRHDVMERGASGSVWRLPAGGAPVRLADGLAWPAGLLPGGGGVLVSESWRHRLRRVGGAGSALDDLPGYPARLTPAAGGGAWLCVFAPRLQLIEFVLREPGYRRRMMAEIDERYWMAPALSSGRSFLEPLQGGAVKHMASLNPWAPTRSYGLVVRLDAAGEPIASLHSRAGGRFHGITSAVEHGGRLLATAKGHDAVIAIAP